MRFQEFAYSILIVATSSVMAVADTGSSLSAADMRAALVGNTVPLGAADMANAKGAMYFVDAENALVTWSGATEEGTWSVGPESQLCYEFAMFGGGECVTFLENDAGGYVWIFEGQQRLLAEGAIVAGKAF